MKNRINTVVFWLIALSIGWLGGRIILWNFLVSLLPKSDVWLPGGLDEMRIKDTYTDIQRLLIGILILATISLIGSLFIYQDTLSSSSSTVAKERQWLKLFVTGAQIALVGYMFAFTAHLWSYWQILFTPPERFIELGDYLGIVASALVTLTVIGYVVIFEPWTIFLKGQLQAGVAKRKRIMLFLYRCGVYIILIILLLGVAAPIPVLKYGIVIVFAAIGVVLGKANLHGKREKAFA